MKSYDDLQRFKEKTHTKHIEFKDMSEQELNSDNTNWTVIKQLLNESAGTLFDNSQRIDAPQPVDPATFSAAEVNTVPSAPFAAQSFVAATPEADDKPGSSLLESISASLPTAETPPAAVKPAVAPAVPVSPPAAPLRAISVARQAAVSGTSLLEQMAAAVPAATVSTPPPAAVTPPPVLETPRAAEPAPRPVMTDAPVNVSYKQLFSAAEAPASGTLEKDQPLQSLLEKIASCR